jgi:hypothetical protein
VSNLPHCKGIGHCDVIGGTSKRTDLDANEVTATYVPAFVCNQWPNEPREVIVLARLGKSGTGLHLLRELWAPTAAALRAVAVDNAGGSAVVRHTVAGTLKAWLAFHPAGAVDLADRIDAAAASAS